MKRKLMEKLRKLSTEILTSPDLEQIGDFYEAAKDLYEKLAVLKYIEEELNEVQVDVSKSPMAAKFETMANAVLSANSSVPESNPHQEDIMTPGIDTIKHMVSEMPTDQGIDEVLAEFLGKPELVKNDKDFFAPALENGAKRTAPKSLNDTFVTKDLKVDLNNRLAFVKHLFDGSTEDFNRVISQLNTMDSWEKSISFINSMVKPDYNEWKGKEEYAERFIALIERRFS
ncbi:MAG: hypothetical protein AAGA86_02980 [Bacteroidota bacterium]